MNSSTARYLQGLATLAPRHVAKGRSSGHQQEQYELVAAPPLPGRTTQTESRASVGHAQLHVRWDRVSVLLALVAVLAMVVAHSVVLAVRDDPPAPAATTAPIQAATPPIQATEQQATAQHACPAATTEVVRTAPAVRDQAAASSRTVALTFDDGPGPATPHVLDVLQRAGVPATFFVIGQDAAANPEMLRRIVADGHVLGDHTWSHHIPRASTGWKASKLARDIERTRRVILDATGLQPCLFRPAGGIVKGAESVTRAAGLSMVLWSVDTRDWSVPSTDDKKFASVIRKRAALGLTQEHPVILLHDGGGNREATVAALQEIINDYRAQGYRFVTLDQPTGEG
jgi:peptidoglycan/xylan/chitin deacetylase (PgdA/CDA1 family)